MFMRRSTCVCDPVFCLAGDVRGFCFIYRSATTLPKGARLRFDMMSKGCVTDWQMPQINTKIQKNLIWADLPNGKGLSAKKIDEAGGGGMYEFTLPQEIKVGEAFTICLGSPTKEKENGNRCQLYAQRRKTFTLHIDPKGKGDFKEQELFYVDIRGNKLHNVRIIVPSLVNKNKRFDVVVRFEDEFGNLTNYAPDDSIMELSYGNQKNNLSWKLFVPETGFICLPSLYFNEVGVYRIQLHNLKTGDKYYSDPIKCLPEVSGVIMWGLFHGESEKSDSIENIETSLRYFRDEKAFQYYGISPFESDEEMAAERWKQISQQTIEFNEDQRFCTFLGFQYLVDEGLVQIVYFKEQKALLRKKDQKNQDLSKVYKSLNSKEVFVIPSFTMGKGFHTDFSDFDPEFERVVEIYNAWGSSECLEKEGNSRPIRSTSKTGVQETEEGSILAALKKNKRFGFVAGGFDSRGVYSKFLKNEQVRYSPGLTAIIAAEQTKEGLIQAICKRSCYATTGERIVLGFNIAGISMGGELSTKTKPGLAINRHIVAYVAGTNVLKEVSLVRNGVVIKTFYPSDCNFECAFDDAEPLGKVAIPPTNDTAAFVFYYLRVRQIDDHLAWSSPIWIDYPEYLASTGQKKQKASTQ
jgi:hypothetical protein